MLLPLVVIAACRGAALRRERPQRRQRPGARAAAPLAGGRRRSARSPLAIALGALVLAQKPLPADDAIGFTALWMLPTDTREDAVAVGVVSNQHDPTSYRLRVSLGKDQSKTYRVHLDPGEERVYEVDVPPRPSGRTHVVASLYRKRRPQKLYRRVTSWLPRQNDLPLSTSALAVDIVITNHNYGALPRRRRSRAPARRPTPRSHVVVVDDGSTDDSREVLRRLRGPGRGGAARSRAARPRR